VWCFGRVGPNGAPLPEGTEIANLVPVGFDLLRFRRLFAHVTFLSIAPAESPGGIGSSSETKARSNPEPKSGGRLKAGQAIATACDCMATGWRMSSAPAGEAAIESSFN